MATNDFIIDLVDKLREESIEFMLITVQKGKEEHKANAFYNINTIDGADMILTTADEVFNNLGSGDGPDDEFKEGSD